MARERNRNESLYTPEELVSCLGSQNLGSHGRQSHLTDKNLIQLPSIGCKSGTTELVKPQADARDETGVIWSLTSSESVKSLAPNECLASLVSRPCTPSIDWPAEQSPAIAGACTMPFSPSVRMPQAECGIHERQSARPEVSPHLCLCIINAQDAFCWRHTAMRAAEQPALGLQHPFRAGQNCKP